MELIGPVVSLVTLAVKIGTGIQQTHSFWSSVRDSSNEVASIVDELNLLRQWLAVIADSYGRQPFERGSASEAAAADTLTLCLKTVRKMDHAVRGYPRSWTFWTAWARKDAVAMALSRLERVKMLLLVAQNCYLAHVQEVGFRNLMHAVANGYGFGAGAGYASQRPAPSMTPVLQNGNSASLIPHPTTALVTRCTPPPGWILMAVRTDPLPKTSPKAVGQPSPLLALGLQTSALGTAVEIPAWMGRW